MDDLPRCRRATWEEAEGWADRVADRIWSADAVPETIVGLARGGWVPGRLLCDRLGVHRLISLRAQHWGLTATRDGKAALTEGLSGPVDGQNVLIIDDITDTGDSLRLATEHVGAAHPKRVETATFLHIDHSTFVPTYHAETISRERWVWVVFPWNYWEDLVALAQKAAQRGRGVDHVRATLRELSGLDVPRADLERIARRAGID